MTDGNRIRYAFLCALWITIHDIFPVLRKFSRSRISEGGFETHPYKIRILILRSLRPLRLIPPILNLVKLF